MTEKGLVNIVIPTSFGGKDGEQALKDIHNQSKKKEVVETPKEVEGWGPVVVARFLGDNWGLRVHNRIMNKYGEYAPFKKMVFDYNMVCGSTPFYVAAANEFLAPFGVRTANHLELEKLVRQGSDLMNETCVQSSLVWRGPTGTNGEYAMPIWEQFSRMGVALSKDDSYVLPLWTLRVYGEHLGVLSFKITSDTLNNYFKADILKGRERKHVCLNEDTFDRKTGLPTEYYLSDLPHADKRRLTRTDEGLSTLGLDGEKNVIAALSKLDYTIPGGHIICVSNSEENYDRIAREL